MTEELKSGSGEIFTELSMDKNRAFFRKKNRRIENKLTTVKEAVSEYLHDGDYISVGGFGSNRVAVSVLHEMLRQGITNLGFAGHTSTHDCEILLAGKAFNRCDVAYVVGLESRGLSPLARRAFQSGDIKVTEWSNAAMAWRLRASAMGVSFMPTRVMLGTDTFKYSAAKEIKCPFTDDKLLALPALTPDVAIIHVHEADTYGNAVIKGISIVDDVLAQASKRVIITAERVVPLDITRNDPDRTSIPGNLVDAVCEVPYGAFPTNMPYEYFSDERHIGEWMKAEKDEKEFEKFIKHQIYDSSDFYEYLNKNGGINRMVELRQEEYLLNKRSISKADENQE